MGRDKEDRVTGTFTFDRLIFNTWREIMLSQFTKLSNRLEEHMVKDIEEYEKKQVVKQNLNNYSIPNRSAIATAAAITTSGDTKIETQGEKIIRTPPRYKSDVSPLDPFEIQRVKQLNATKERLRKDEEFRLKWEQEQQDKDEGILSDSDDSVLDDPTL